jgi:hypothetical protein
VASDLHRWEIIVPPEQFESVVSEVSSVDVGDVRMSIAPIVSIGAPGAPVHHFVAAGFDTKGDQLLDVFCEIDDRRVFTDLVFRIPATDEAAGALERAKSLAVDTGRRAVVIVELPRAGESTVFADDDSVSSRVAEMAEQAKSEEEVSVFLDGFVDHDRGYYSTASSTTIAGTTRATG